MTLNIGAATVTHLLGLGSQPKQKIDSALADGLMGLFNQGWSAGVKPGGSSQASGGSHQQPSSWHDPKTCSTSSQSYMATLGDVNARWGNGRGEQIATQNQNRQLDQLDRELAQAQAQAQANNPPARTTPKQS